MFVAVNTVDVIIWTIGKIGRIHLMFTFRTGETFPMVAARLGDLLLSLEHSALAARTDVHVTILTLEDSHIGIMEIGSKFGGNIRIRGL